MKRIFLLITVAILSLGFMSCDMFGGLFGGLNDQEAVEVVQALITPVAGDYGDSRDLSRATSSFSYTDTQSNGGTAKITYTVDTNSTDATAIMDGTMTIVFDEYVTEIVTEAGDEKEYTVTGTIYYDLISHMEYTTSSLTYTYEIDMYTDTNEPVEVTGNGVNTDVELDIVETMDMVMTVTDSTYTYTVTYDCSGTVNDIEIDGESGTITFNFTE